MSPGEHCEEHVVHFKQLFGDQALMKPSTVWTTGSKTHTDGAGWTESPSVWTRGTFRRRPDEPPQGSDGDSLNGHSSLSFLWSCLFCLLVSAPLSHVSTWSRSLQAAHLDVGGARGWTHVGMPVRIFCTYDMSEVNSETNVYFVKSSWLCTKLSNNRNMLKLKIKVLCVCLNVLLYR